MAQIDKLKAEKAAWQRARPPSTPKIWVHNIKVGRFGTLVDPSVYLGPGRSVSHWFNVFNIVNENEMLVQMYDQNVWVRGIPTTGLVDGKRVSLDRVFEVTGMKRYPTAIGGSTTVFVIEPFEPPSLSEKRAAKRPR